MIFFSDSFDMKRHLSREIIAAAARTAAPRRKPTATAAAAAPVAASAVDVASTPLATLSRNYAVAKAFAESHHVRDAALTGRARCTRLMRATLVVVPAAGCRR